MLATASDDGTVKIWDASNLTTALFSVAMELGCQLTALSNVVRSSLGPISLSWSADSTILAVGDDAGAVMR